MIHAADPGDRELMPSQWQRSKTLTQIQLCPPGDGQMDIANVSLVPRVSIIDPGKRKKTDMRDHNDPVSKCKVPHSCFYVCIFPHRGEEQVVILFTATQL